MQTNGICDAVSELFHQELVAPKFMLVIQVLTAVFGHITVIKNVADVMQESCDNESLACIGLHRQVTALQGVLQLGHFFRSVSFRPFQLESVKYLTDDWMHICSPELKSASTNASHNNVLRRNRLKRSIAMTQ